MLKRLRHFTLEQAFFILLLLLVLLIVHLLSVDNFPFQAGYAFPWKDFLVHFVGTYALWSIQNWNFKRFYKSSLIKNGFSVALIMRTIAVNLLIAVVFYLLYVPLVVALVYQQPLSIYGLVVGMSVSLLLILLLNFIYFGREIYQLWKQVTEHSTHSSGKQGDVTTSALLQSAPEVPEQIIIHTGRETIQLPLQQIGYFISKHKMVFAILYNGRKISTHFTLSELESSLSAECYFRVSRQLVVSRQVISAVRKEVNNKLLLEVAVPDHPPEEAVVSRYKAADFKKWFNA